jgi:hypothetical protein
MKEKTSFWRNHHSWQGYKFTKIGIVSGIAKALCDYYWVMTSLPLAESHEDNEVLLKTFYMSGQVLLNGLIQGVIGLSCDYSYNFIYSSSNINNEEQTSNISKNNLPFFQKSRNWRDYKFTITSIGLGMAKILFDNYWVMTSIPLAQSQGENESLLKTFYMLGQILLTIPIYGMPGLSCDYLNNFFHLICQDNNEECRLNIKI